MIEVIDEGHFSNIMTGNKMYWGICEKSLMVPQVPNHVKDGDSGVKCRSICRIVEYNLDRTSNIQMLYTFAFCPCPLWGCERSESVWAC